MEVKEKYYSGDCAGKKAFVSEVLSPLMVQIGSGYSGAEYVRKDDRENVNLISCNEVQRTVNVTGDSLFAIICDVLKCL